MNDKKEPEDTPETEPTRMKRFFHFLSRPKIGIPLVVLMLLITAPFCYRSYRINQLPNIDHPFDFDAFLNFKVPDDENAYVEYKQAMKKLVEFKGDFAALEKMKQALRDGWDATPGDVKKWLEDNREALEIWKKGTEKPDVQNESMKNVTPGSMLPAISEFETFGYLAVLESNRLQKEGNPIEAWEWNRALFRFSRHLGKRGFYIRRLLGNAMFRNNDFSFQSWLENPDVDASLFRQALKEMEWDYRMSPPAIETLKAEYALQLKVFNLDFAMDIDPSPGKSDSIKGRRKRLWWYFQGEPEFSTRAMRHLLTNWFQEIEKPLWERADTIPGSFDLYRIEQKRLNGNVIDPFRIASVSKGALFAKDLSISRARLESSAFQDQARYHCLRIAIAAQIYLREHGSYPEKLEELKNILGEIPYDPCYSASRRDLQYHRENNGFVVWSVGENEFDDGGDVKTEERVGRDVGFRITIKVRSER